MKEVIRISRETMIEHLINSTFDHIQQVPETLDSYLRYGFTGFENYTDKQLIEDYVDYVSEDPNVDIEIVLEDAQ